MKNAEALVDRRVRPVLRHNLVGEVSLGSKREPDRLTGIEMWDRSSQAGTTMRERERGTIVTNVRTGEGHSTSGEEDSSERKEPDI